MARYVARSRSSRPADEVFAYLADLRNFAEWDPGVTSSVQVEGDGTALGSAYDVTVKGIGRDLTLRYELVELVAPQRFVAKAVSSALTSVDTVTVEATDAGSVVTYDAELTLNGILAVGDVFLRLMFGRIGDRAAAGLRRALDAEALDG